MVLMVGASLTESIIKETVLTSEDNEPSDAVTVNCLVPKSLAAGK